MKDKISDKITLEHRGIESEEEYDPKNADLSEEEPFIYDLRRESSSSSASNVSNASQESTMSSKELEEAKSDVEELTEQFKTSVKVDEKTNEVESMTDQLKTKLIVTEEKDLQERQPTRLPAHYLQNRSATDPYQQTRRVHHYSGGFVSQNDQLNINYGQPSRAASASPPQLVPPSVSIPQNDHFNFNNAQSVEESDALQIISGDDVDDFFLNDLPPFTQDVFNNSDTASILNNLPPGPEPSNQATYVSPDGSFSTRQSTPPHSDSPGSSPSYTSCDLFSPQSSFSSDTSQSIGSPQNTLYNLPPSTSRSSFASSNSSVYLPITLPNTSDEEDEQNQESTNELRNLIDTKLKEIKKSVWINANLKDVDTLISELHKLLCKNSRLTDRKLVQIYSAIWIILQQNGPLREFFVKEPNILSYVALKNHPLLFKYIIETMQNLGLNPEALAETPTTVLRKVIEQNQDMKEILKVLLSMKTKTGSLMFDMNEINENVIHQILLKISKAENPKIKELAISYLQICLLDQPDFTMRTQHNRTYLHHAVALGCGPVVVEMILRSCASSNPTFDLVNETDASGNCALRLAANLTHGRKEVEDVLLRYNAFNIYQEVDQNVLNPNFPG